MNTPTYEPRGTDPGLCREAKARGVDSRAGRERGPPTRFRRLLRGLLRGLLRRARRLLGVDDVPRP